MIRITTCPPCSTPEQWRLWSKQNVLAKSKDNFCVDCTLEYRERMTKASKCIQEPSWQKYMEKTK